MKELLKVIEILAFFWAFAHAALIGVYIAKSLNAASKGNLIRERVMDERAGTAVVNTLFSLVLAVVIYCVLK